MFLPVLERYLDGIEAHGFGGTCYSNGYHQSLLLARRALDGMDLTRNVLA